MNAAIDTADRAPARPAVTHSTHKLKLLLKREFWEHKGGFFWAPIWASAISLLFTLMALGMAEYVLRSHNGIHINGKTTINGLDLGALTSQMSPEDMAQLSQAISMSTATAMFWPLLVLGFVVFFYCLGSLFDERKDRSVLFWKSLPVSDRDTVLSKLASALLIAPAIATAIGILCMVAYLLLLSVFVLIHGANPFTLLWHPGNLLANAGVAIAALPIYALWALPSVGWLMLCSAWAKSKPFLWAIMVPVFTGVLVSWFDLMSVFNLGSSWIWRNVIAHVLGGVFPGTWLFEMNPTMLQTRTDASLDHMAVLKGMYTVLATPQLWIGVVAGIAMIIAAIRLRRWRDEG